jgi:hypothetical protein
MTKYRKVNLTLPNETAEHLREVEANRALLPSVVTALRMGGWTLESIAEPLGMTRENVRLIAQKSDVLHALDEARRAGFIVPEPPHAPVRAKIYRPEPLPENLERLKELQPLAQQVRASVSRYRAEAEEYTRILNYEHETRGVSLYRLAKDLGVTHGALRFRLVRYGYKTTESSAKVYQPIVTANRAL